MQNLIPDTHNVLISLSLLVVLSYVFNILFRYTRIPPVILLLLTGALLKIAGDQIGLQLPGTKPLLELFGVIGLILIVLEGSLDLKITRERMPLIWRSLLSALLTLLATCGIITVIFMQLMEMPFQQALVYSVPMGVISSSIAIPSVSNLSQNKKEFIIYESTFSDILGIMLFNYVSGDAPHSTGAVIDFALDTISILLISGLSSLVLIFLLNSVRSHIKSFLVFAILVLIYSVSKLYHLPSLLLILVFGLMLNNSRLFTKGRFEKKLDPRKITEVTHELKLITAESAFLIRTFFFILFGYTMHFTQLVDTSVIITGSFVIGTILIVRMLFLRFISHTNLIPEMFIAPRGLITVILFYNIPERFRIDTFSEGILLFVILVSAIVMMLALMFSKKEYQVTDDLQT